MFCKNCGATIPDGSAVCSVCGITLTTPQQGTYYQTPYQQPVQTPYQQPVQTPYQQPAQTPYQQPAQTPYQQTPYQQPMYPQQVPHLGQADLSMKWYKFLVSFGLIASAVINVIGGFATIIGFQYETEIGNVQEIAYAIFDGLQILDWLSALSAFALAGLAISARMKLAKMEKDAPSKISLLYTVNAISSIVLLIGCFIVLGDAVDGEIFENQLSSYVSSIISSIIFMIANKKYFEKRKHLFVN